MWQHTISVPICARGLGLTSGRVTTMRLRPTSPDAGIVFERTDLAGRPPVQADVNNAVWKNGRLLLRCDNIEIHHAEPLLSALYGLGVDNVIVSLDGADVPTLDLGVASYVFLLQAAGVLRQDVPRSVLNPQCPTMVQGAAGWVRLYAHDSLRFALLAPQSEAGLSSAPTDRITEFSRALFVTDLCHFDDESCQTLAFLNTQAEKNRRRHIWHQQGNRRIAHALSMFALLRGSLQGIFVRMGDEKELDFRLVCELSKQRNTFQNNSRGRYIASVV